jgi:cytochrome c-type biogenesis protein CcmH/NrfG
LIGESARILKRAHDKLPKDFEVAVALGTAHYDLGSLKEDKAEWKLSQEFLGKALEIKPDNVAARADYGSTFAFADPPDLSRAVTEIRKALETEPRNARALLLLTQALLMQNSPEADAVYKKLKEVDPKAPSIDTLKRDGR